MPSFDLLNRVELFIRTGQFPADSTQSSRKVTRAASKRFLYKDGCLWRSYRGRLLRVIRNEEEMKEVLIRYHDNNNHAGRARAVKEIMLLYYWVGVTEAVKNWLKDCAVCQGRNPAEPHVNICLAYGCDASSHVYPELSFHKFPKEAERRRRWLALAQRDEGSLRFRSCLCSRHFEPSCFTLSEDGQLTLAPDALPTIRPATQPEDKLPDQVIPVRSEEDLLHLNTTDLLSSSAAAAAETAEPSEPAADRCEAPAGLQEHQYCLPDPDPDPDSAAVQAVKTTKRRKIVIEQNFAVYHHIARYLSHKVLPMQSNTRRAGIKRMTKRFALIDGVLMYTRVSPPVRVARSKEEVNLILEQFHDNQGHFGLGICQRKISKHFFWANMTRDVARWVASCTTCLNRTKRRYFRCSVYNCTNCCGPVERGLGLTFHRFPLNNAARLTQWLKAVGRPNWHPRLGSSVCSTHFTEDCFDRGGEKVTLRPDAVPTLLLHGDSATPSRSPARPAVMGETNFARYDAVELYLSRRKYPPGLSYVEKNTFRRFCKSFGIIDGKLHMVRGDQVRLVLRDRRQVEAALLDFHNELNHLDAKKCLRLLNERYFWKTMKPDVVQWINSCSQCGTKRKRPETEAQRSESPPEALRSPQIHDDSDRGNGDEDVSDADEDDGGSVRDEGTEASADRTTRRAIENSASSRTVTPIRPQPRIPILLHLRAPINLQPRNPIILQARSPNTPVVGRLWPVRRTATPQQPAVPMGNSSSDIWTENQTCVRVQVDQNRTLLSQGNARSPHFVKVQTITRPLSGSRPPPELPAETRLPSSEHVSPPSPNGVPKTRIPRPQTSTQTRSHSSILEKRKTHPEGGSPAKRSSSSGLEPVVAPSNKPWPVFTIGGLAAGAEGDISAPLRRSRGLQAQTVIQQCSSAKVKTRPAVDGVDAQWAEIQEGLVVYVCFFHGATDDVTCEMASALMTTKFFRKDTGHSVSVLDLPGSVLLIPQDSLLGEPVPRRRVRFRGGCELWRGAQLFSKLASACRELMSGSARSAKAGVRLEQGVYGQKQEMVLSSPEPLTLLLKF